MINKFKIFLSLILFVVGTAFADDLSIKVDPYEPLINEPFSVIFNINTQSEKGPYISFDPGRAEVIEREKGGVSLQTTIINGKISSKREITYRYQLVTDRPGILRLKNIVVDTGDGKITHKDLRIKILRKSKVAKNIFVKAVVSKQDAFLGEGLDLNYYLYYRVQAGGTEIKRFPKLKNFVKRFRNVRAKEERVEESGLVYVRQLVYSARIFPEKVGELKIDPISINVQYVAGNRGNSRGGFGFQFRQYKRKTLRSKTVKVNVKAIPSGMVPKNFTGLIGKHDFKLVLNNNRYLVNEAIEFKFEATGPGMLENYEPPTLYSHDSLESFDTKSEMVEISGVKSKKVFEYTYLARGPLDLAESEVELSYFDQDKEAFVGVKVVTPSLKVAGVASVGKRSGAIRDGAPKKEDTPGPPPRNRLLIAPEFTSYEAQGGVSKKYITLAVYILFVVFLALVLLWFSLTFWKRDTSDIDIFLKKIEKVGINYSNLYALLSLLLKNGEDKKIETIIKGSPLSDDAKTYFKNSLVLAEENNYSGSKENSIKFKKRFFTELKKVLNESNR